MKTVYAFFLASAGLLALTGCGGDEDRGGARTGGPACLLKQMVYRQAGKDDIGYIFQHEDNRLQRIVMLNFSSKDTLGLTSYTYDDEGRVTEIRAQNRKGGVPGSSKYYYNGDKTQPDSALSTGRMDVMAYYEYDSKGRLTGASSFAGARRSAGEAPQFSVEMKWEGDNITEVKIGSPQQGGFTRLMTYDSHPAATPWPQGLLPAWAAIQDQFAMSAHNPVNTTISTPDMESGSMSFSSDYEYNDKGFPLKEVRQMNHTPLNPQQGQSMKMEVEYSYDCR